MSSVGNRTRGFAIADLADTLAHVGIRPGDTVVMHSSLMHIGRPFDCPLGDYPRRVIEHVLDYLGQEGTLAVPAPNWDYGLRDIPFNIRSSPVERSIGACSAHLVTLSHVERSPNPIFSVAAIGRHARYICAPDTGSAFGVGSAWDRLFELNARVLMVGSGVDSLTFVRYIEFRAGVPYLYNKLFTTAVVDGERPLSIAVTAPLRFRHCPAKYRLQEFGGRIRRAGAMCETAFGGGTMSMIPMSDCYEIGIRVLRENIHFFLENSPAYVPGEIPIA